MIDYQEPTTENKRLFLLTLHRNSGNISNLPSHLLNNYYLAQIGIKEKPQSFAHFSHDIRSNHDIFKLALENSHKEYAPLEHTSIEIQNNKALVLLSVKSHGRNLKFAPAEFKNDYDIVMEAVSNMASAIRFASTGLKNDYSLAKIILNQSSYALKHLSPTLQDNDELVDMAVSRYGGSLEFASDRLKNNKELVLKAIENHPNAIKHISPELQEDIEIAKIALFNAYENIKNKNDDVENDFFQHISVSLRNNFELLQWFFNHDLWRPQFPHCVPYIGEHIKDSAEDMLLLSVQFPNTSFTGVLSERLKNDKATAMMFTSQQGNNLSYFSSTIKDDSSVVFNAIMNHPPAFRYASQTLRSNLFLAKVAIKKDGYTGKEGIKHVAPSLFESKEFMEYAVAVEADYFDYFSPSLKEDKPFITSLLKKYPIFAHLPSILKNDEELIKIAVNQDYRNIAFLSQYSLNNPHLMLYFYHLTEDHHFIRKFLGKDLKEEIGEEDPLQYLQKKVLNLNLQKDLNNDTAVMKKMKI